MCACVSCLSSLLTHSQSHYHTNLLLAHQPSDTNTNTTTTGTWEAATDLVGHEQPSQCVCFAPQIKVSRPLAADADADADANADRDAVAVTSASAVESASASAVTVTPVCTVAMGDALGVVSLWASNSNKAALVLKDCFDGKNRAATDISWIRHGGIDAFAASSMDGSVVIVDVQGQLGKCIYIYVCVCVCASMCVCLLSFALTNPLHLHYIFPHICR